MTSATPVRLLEPALRLPKSGRLFRRIMDAVAASDRRKAEHPIATSIRRPGGKRADSVERLVEKGFLHVPTAALI